MISIFIFLNGIYDVVCSLCILKIIDIPIMRRMHLSMIKSPQKNLIFERSFGFFILSYGIIRIYGNMNIISLSYLLEALYFLSELKNNTVHTEKSIFVITSCLYLCYVTMNFSTSIH